MQIINITEWALLNLAEKTTANITTAEYTYQLTEKKLKSTQIVFGIALKHPLDNFINA